MLKTLTRRFSLKLLARITQFNLVFVEEFLKSGRRAAERLPAQQHFLEAAERLIVFDLVRQRCEGADDGGAGDGRGGENFGNRAQGATTPGCDRHAWLRELSQVVLLNHQPR